MYKKKETKRGGANVVDVQELAKAGEREISAKLQRPYQLRRPCSKVTLDQRCVTSGVEWFLRRKLVV